MAFMELIPWNRPSSLDLASPIEGMRGLLESMERALTGTEFRPKIELEERANLYFVKAALPGMSKEDVEVEVSPDTLTIRCAKTGERKHKGASSKESRCFMQSFTLPGQIKTGEVKASFKDGTLSLQLPKAKPTEQRKVEIK